ncbi:MAG: hypothetical protein DSY36_00280 [Candidatus Neomarinimicrobiota bacterium]|nr:MAG: hypothetical protein DSY36_00280 [Candidatus Neomarinimicrobiota bacterium]
MICNHLISAREEKVRKIMTPAVYTTKFKKSNPFHSGKTHERSICFVINKELECMVEMIIYDYTKLITT